MLKYRNPEIPEGINTTDTHPLKEFSFLISVILAAVIIITAILAVSIDWLAEYIPFEVEASLSQSVAKKLNNENNEIDAYLQDLADKITPYMALPEGMNITLHYVDEETVNAMATLGGHVMIYRGLLEKLPNENTLVMLLGHEIGHIKLRHPVKALGKGVVIGLLLSTVLGQSSDSVAGVLTDTSMITMLSFNRQQEEDSDDEGIKVMHAYYGHVQSSTELFEILKQDHQGTGLDVPQFLSSHPDTEYRIQHLNELAQTQNWLQQGRTRLIPGDIINKLAEDSKQNRHWEK